MIQVAEASKKRLRGLHKQRNGGRRQAQHAGWTGGISYFCTGPSCRRMVQVRHKLIRVEEPKLDKDLPMLYHLETQCVNGHDSTCVYVATQRNINRFGKSGSY